MSAAGPRPHRLFPHFNPEAAAVVCILLGLFQLILAAPLYYLDISLPKKLFLLPLAIGILVVAAGSLTMASERSPNRQLLRGCAYSNVACLLGALCALCVYGVSLRSVEQVECPQPTQDGHDYFYSERQRCPREMLEAFFRCVVVLLLLYDLVAALLCSLLSASCLQALRHT